MYRGVLIDMEDTLWTREEDALYQTQAKARLAAMLGHPDPSQLWSTISSRLQQYRTWAESEQKEVKDFTLWHDWLYPELDETNLRCIDHSLTAQLRRTEGRRKPRPGALRAIRALYDRGCRLGVVSNSLGEHEIPDWLEETGMKQYFDAVITSALSGLRSPDPKLYIQACEELGLPPSECASISSGGMEGEKAAGIGAVIRLTGAEGASRPDYTINGFLEILELPDLR